MSTVELKNIIKSRIDSITDNDFLNALNIILISKTRDVIILSDEQKLGIKKSIPSSDQKTIFLSN